MSDLERHTHDLAGNKYGEFVPDLPPMNSPNPNPEPIKCAMCYGAGFSYYGAQLLDGKVKEKRIDCEACGGTGYVQPTEASKDWQPFTGSYEKRSYEVQLPDGTILQNGWPNAGKMHVGGKVYGTDSGIMVRLQDEVYMPPTVQPTEKPKASDLLKYNWSSDQDYQLAVVAFREQLQPILAAHTAELEQAKKEAWVEGYYAGADKHRGTA